MNRAMSSLVITLPFFSLALIATISVGFCCGCIENERRALLDLKDGLTDPSNTLANWVPNGDCCAWDRVFCDNLTGHVSKLFLSHTPFDSSQGMLPFGGKISPSLLNLTYLNFLDFSGNDFGGIEIPPFIVHLENLTNLHLEDSGFVGRIPNHIGNLRKLEYLYLNYNLLEGDISQFSFANLTKLAGFFAQGNKLNGTVHESVGGLTELEIIDIRDNLLEGNILEIHFANLTKLVNLYASGNRLTLKVRPEWIPPQKLVYLFLDSWNVGPQFPNWLRSLNCLQWLSLSNTGIMSTIPTWFWYNNSSPISFLDLSKNQIHGTIPNTFAFGSDLLGVNLSSNNFQGPLLPLNVSASSIDLSNNLFSGSMSNFLCHLMNVSKFKTAHLNLEDNLLSGEIPDCWMNWPDLVTLRLNNNKLSGNIPRSIGTLSILQSLHIRNNNLSGEIPSSLETCGKLFTLDLGENVLTGTIPTWIGERFASLVILNLRENNLYGHIPNELCHLASLKVLDIASNSLFGTIPSCMRNFSAMTATTDSSGTIIYFEISGSTVMETAILVTKGRTFEYSTILNFVRNIDLSDNNLSGKIPEELTSLEGLQSLNLSHNSLSGTIPKDIGAMQMLESIDFSLNKFSGVIPQSLASLTFLSYLNLSYNNLIGKIPTSTQLQSFNSSCFSGNKGLYGPPLTSIDSNRDGIVPAGIEKRQGKDDNGGFLEKDWFYFYVGAVFGFVVGFWIVVGSLVCNRRWQFAYFRFLNHLGSRISVRF